MENYTKPVIRIENIDAIEGKTLHTSPSIYIHIQGSNVSHLTVDVFLDNKSLCFDSFTYNTFAWDFITFKQYIYVPSDDVWNKIYDGDHTIIFTVTDSNEQVEEVHVSFTRDMNPYATGSELLVPITPNYGDNEALKLGALSFTRTDRRTTNTKTIAINQFTSYGFCTPNNYFDTLFDSVYGEDYFGEYDTLLVKRGARDKDGWLTSPPYSYDERIFFEDTEDELKKWSWVKTTLPDNKVIFIATTTAPVDFLHPTSKINISMGGLTFVMRCLTQKEWMSIDPFVLEKIDFGKFMMNSWHTYNIITSTNHTDLDNSILATAKDKADYNNRFVGKDQDNYLSMTYVSEEKSNALGWKKGWGFALPIRPDYDDGRNDVFWIPTLEVINNPPVVDLPDKNKDNPIYYL